MSAANDAIKYAKKIVKGKKPANKYVRLACQRFLDDLDRDDLDFRPRAAERVVHFIEQLPHVKGPLRRTPFLLADWQKFIIANLFGFYGSDGFRRFQEAFILVPRKNGKSFFAAAIGLYMLLLDDPGAAEVYCGATTEKQANYVFDPAKLIVKHCPDLVADFGVVLMAESITVPDEDSTFQRIVGDPGDGGNPNCWIVDEYHEHRNNNLYETGKTGMGARENPLLLTISTAGSNIEGPCYDTLDDCKNILTGVFDDIGSDATFVLPFGVDKGDKWDSIAALKKANPNYGVSVSEKKLKLELASAKRSPRLVNGFKTKHLNIWVNATDPLLDYDKWVACGNSELNIEDFKHLPCVIGVDLSSTIDITAAVKVFFEKVDQVVNYYVFAEFWIPEERITEQGAPEYYATWREEGLFNVCPGDEISKGMVVEKIEEDSQELHLQEIVFDPWKSSGYEQDLEGTGVEIVRFPQTIGHYTGPCDELVAANRSSRIHHQDNKVLNWMASNLEVKRDTNGNCKPRKENAKKKIDGMSAMLMAIGRAMITSDDHVDLGTIKVLG